MQENVANREAVHLAHVSRGSDGRPTTDYFVHLTFEFEEEEDVWCGHCVELGTAAFADTREQAHAELLDATILQLDGVEQLNELEAYLAKNGVLLYPVIPAVDEDDLLHQPTAFAELVPA